MIMKTNKQKMDGYKEIVTEGFNHYKLPITDSKGKTEMVDFVATLVEVVPDHKECSTCKKYISKMEVDLSPTLISCKHKKFTENKINERAISYHCEECGGSWPGRPKEPYWTPVNTQEYMCLECFGHIFDMENPNTETTWHGVMIK